MRSRKNQRIKNKEEEDFEDIENAIEKLNEENMGYDNVDAGIDNFENFDNFSMNFENNSSNDQRIESDADLNSKFIQIPISVGEFFDIKFLY